MSIITNPADCSFLLCSGVYAFGLFTVDIFANAGQVVTGNLAPHFLTVCKPNYTALGCQQALRYVSHQDACTGNQEDILRARKSFPSKEAALSIYAALYGAVSSSQGFSSAPSAAEAPPTWVDCQLLAETLGADFLERVGSARVSG